MEYNYHVNKDVLVQHRHSLAVVQIKMMNVLKRISKILVYTRFLAC